MYINTILFTCLHFYIFEHSRDHPEGVLIHFVSQQRSVCVTYYTLLCSLILTYEHVFCWSCS